MPHLRALLRRSRSTGGPSGGRKYATIFVELLEFFLGAELPELCRVPCRLALGDEENPGRPGVICQIRATGLLPTYRLPTGQASDPGIKLLTLCQR